MKKLKLDQQKFAGAEVLSRAQLRKVMGGNGSFGGDDCDSTCSSDSECGDGLICKGVDMSGVCKDRTTVYHCLTP